MRILDTWKMLPKAARRYIMYHTIINPVIFTWILVPYLILEVGLTVLEAGIIYTVASFFGALISYLVGRYLDYVDPVLIMLLIGIIEGASDISYYLGLLLKILLLITLGAIIERISSSFYVAYGAYEYDVYPEEIRDRAFMVHNLFPYLSQLISFPILGFLLSMLPLSWKINSLAVFSLFTFLSGVLAYLMLPKIKKEKLEISRGSFEKISRDLLPTFLVLVLLAFGNALSPYIAIVYLFTKISRDPLLGLSLFEAVEAIPVVISSVLMLKSEGGDPKRRTFSGILIISLSYLVLFFATSSLIAILSSLLLSLGYSIMDPYLMDALFSKIPEERRGEILGAISGVRRLILIPTPGIAGFLASIDPHLPFLTSFMIILSAAILVLFARVIKEERSSSSYPPYLRPLHLYDLLRIYL